MFWVDEVAVASSFALSVGVLAALGLAEVRDGAVLDLNGDEVVALTRHLLQGLLGLIFRGILDIEVTNHVLADIIRHNHVEYLAKFAELEEHFLEEFFEVESSLNKFLLRRFYSFSKCNSCLRIFV